MAVDSNGTVSSFSGYYIPNIDVDVSDAKTDEEMKSFVVDYLGEGASIVSSEKVIYILEDTPTLAYHVVGTSNDKAKDMIWDAETGELIIDTDLFSL